MVRIIMEDLMKRAVFLGIVLMSLWGFEACTTTGENDNADTESITAAPPRPPAPPKNLGISRTPGSTGNPVTNRTTRPTGNPVTNSTTVPTKTPATGTANSDSKAHSEGYIDSEVTVPSLTAAGNMDLGTIQAKALNTAIIGSGNINGTVEVDEVFTLVVSGSGTATVAGSGKRLAVEITGSGDFNGEEFCVDDASIIVSGSGTARVWFLNSLNAVITGAGNIIYRGDPEKVTQTKTGSGWIQQKK
jgi:hypothetical protein